MAWLWWISLVGGCAERISSPDAAAIAAPEVAVLSVPPPLPLQVDLHLDTPTQMNDRRLDIDDPALEAGLSKLRAGGTQVAVMALWPQREGDLYGRVLAQLEALERSLAGRTDAALARSPVEARALAGEGKIAIVVALEGAYGLGDPWQERLEALHARGLAVLGVVWSSSSRFAGSSGDGGGGLSAEGQALAQRARALGIVLDLSHASRAATMDLCRTSAIPVIASHSNADAVLPHARNLTDDEIRCIADSGGVIGLNFHQPFAGGGAARLADHADHIAAIAGRGAVGMGTDYDGNITVPAQMPDAATVGALWAELAQRGWSEAELTGVRGENFLRAWGEVIEKSSK